MASSPNSKKLFTTEKVVNLINKASNSKQIHKASAAVVDKASNAVLDKASKIIESKVKEAIVSKNKQNDSKKDKIAADTIHSIINQLGISGQGIVLD